MWPSIIQCKYTVYILLLIFEHLCDDGNGMLRSSLETTKFALTICLKKMVYVVSLGLYCGQDNEISDYIF